MRTASSVPAAKAAGIPLFATSGMGDPRIIVAVKIDGQQRYAIARDPKTGRVAFADYSTGNFIMTDDPIELFKQVEAARFNDFNLNLHDRDIAQMFVPVFQSVYGF